jgi:hypothetical protein
MRTAQLKLVTDKAPVHDITTDPTRQVFERWVFMFGRDPRRTKLDTERRHAINAALALYDGDVQTIMLAVDGMAAAPLGDKPESMQDAMREIDWFLGSAKRIERALRWSDVLRHNLEVETARRAEPAPLAADEPSAEQVAHQRETLRALAARLSGRQHA